MREYARENGELKNNEGNDRRDGEDATRKDRRKDAFVSNKQQDRPQSEATG